MNAESSSNTGRGDSHDQTNRDESHKTTQNSYSIIQDNDIAEIDKINNLRYMCNFSCLPTHDQQEILGCKKQSNENIHVISVNEAKTDSGRKTGPEIKNEVKLCKKCHVFENKCECPNLCDICNEMMTQKNLCKCARQHVKSLATKISK